MVSLSSAQVMVKFFESDCPVIPRGQPVKGRHIDDGPQVKLEVRKAMTDADIGHAAACLGMIPDGAGKWKEKEL